MHWLNDNAGAIQAISTVVLVFITTWYVLVTRWIAKSAAEDVRQMRETLRVNQERSAENLFYFARRIRNESVR